MEPGDVWQEERELAELFDAAEIMEAANRCPKCGAECGVESAGYNACIETFVRFCTDCPWEGKPE